MTLHYTGTSRDKNQLNIMRSEMPKQLLCILTHGDSGENRNVAIATCRVTRDDTMIHKCLFGRSSNYHSSAVFQYVIMFLRSTTEWLSVIALVVRDESR